MKDPMTSSEQNDFQSLLRYMEDHDPIVASYNITKRSLYKFNGSFFFQVQSGYPVGGEHLEDDILEPHGQCSLPLTKHEAVGLLRAMHIDPENINLIMGEDVSRMTVPRKVLRKIWLLGLNELRMSIDDDRDLRN